MEYFFVVSFLVFLLFVWVGRESTKPPQGRAEQMLAGGRPSGTLVACLGDSITHGRVSDDWVGRLRAKFAPEDTHFINAGINGYVAWQLGQRLEPVLSAKPDVAVVLIGTNDVMGSFDEGDGKLYKRDGKLPQVPSRPFYQCELRGLLERLQSIPKRAICTLPPLGEDPGSEINQLVQTFNEDIRTQAAELGFEVLPLYDELSELLETRDGPPSRDYLPGKSRLGPIVSAVLQYYLLRRSWDEIAARRGLVMTPDYIHLGERAGGVMESLVEDFVRT